MNSDVTIIQSRFHYTEKAYVPNTSNIVVIIDELIKLMEPHFRKQAPTFRLINDLRFDHPETAPTYDKNSYLLYGHFLVPNSLSIFP